MTTKFIELQDLFVKEKINYEDKGAKWEMRGLQEKKAPQMKRGSFYVSFRNNVSNCWNTRNWFTIDKAKFCG